MEVFVYIWIENEFIPAGKIHFQQTAREGQAYFAYGRKYLERKNAIALDPINLPLEERQFSASSDSGLFGAIRDAGPDRWGRYLLNKKFNRELNELEYVLATGPDRVGALAFGPDLQGPRVLSYNGYGEHITKNFNLEYCQKATEDALANAETEELKGFLEYGSSLGGARPKASVIWKNKPHLAKFSVSLDRRNEPLIECAAMRLAQLAGLNVPSIEHVKVFEKDVYLIERFDRRVFESIQDKIHFISALTAGDMFESGYDQWSYALLCQAIDKICENPQKDKEELYKRMIFNILVNNDDDHPRNHGFLHIGKNKWCLSPLYDVVPRDQNSNTFRLAMLIGDYGKEASKKNALSAASYFNITEKKALSIWQELESLVLESWERVFSESGLTQLEIERFKSSIGIVHKT